MVPKALLATLGLSLVVSLFAGCLEIPAEYREAFEDDSTEVVDDAEPIDRAVGFGEVRGVVRDADGRPVRDAIVVADTGAWTYSDAGGAFVLNDLPSGFQPIQAYQRGYAVASAIADVYADETAVVEMALAVGSIEPPAVEVVAEGRVRNQLFLSFHDEETTWRLVEGALLLHVHAQWTDGPAAPLPFFGGDDLAMTLLLQRAGDEWGEEFAHAHDGGHAEFLLDKEALDGLNYTAKDEFAARIHAHDPLADRGYELRAVALYRLGLPEELPEPAPPEEQPEEPPATEPYLDVVEFRGRTGLTSWFQGGMEEFLVPLAGDERDVVLELEWVPATPGPPVGPLGMNELHLAVEACGKVEGDDSDPEHAHGDGEMRCEEVAREAGASPLRIDLDNATLEALFADGRNELRVRVHADFLTVDQSYRLVASLFHAMEAPDDYTGLTTEPMA